MIDTLINFFYKTPTSDVARAEGAGVQMGRVVFAVGAVALAIVLLVAVL